MLITFLLMLGMVAVAEPVIITLIGEKWRPSVIYLQMLSFVGMFYPLLALNLNMFMVQGRYDLFLKLEIVKKALAFPNIVIGIFYGIKAMIAGMMVNTVIAYSLNSYWSGYSFKQQVKDILPAFFLALVMAAIVYGLGQFLPLKPLPLFIIQIVTGVAFTKIFSELTRFQDYFFKIISYGKIFNHLNTKKWKKQINPFM